MAIILHEWILKSCCLGLYDQKTKMENGKWIKNGVNINVQEVRCFVDDINVVVIVFNSEIKPIK